MQMARFYSLSSGDWSDPGTWTHTETHTGPSASRAPEILDTVIIGNNHVVVLTGNITNNQQVTILDSGTLSFGEYILSGEGVFGLQAGATIEIGSADGITLSDPAGNVQMDERSFSSGANYVYNGALAQVTGDALPQTVANLTIDNPAGVLAAPSMDITVNGTLTLSEGIFTMSPGRSLVTSTNGVDATGGGQIRMQQEINGTHGYRMLASPLVTTYADLLDGFVTQGLPGSTWPDRQPNLLYFEETYADSDVTANQSWRTISGLTDGIISGRGYFFYVFGDIPEDNDYSDPLPKTMTATGLEPGFTGSGDTFEFDVTHTPTRESTAFLEGWNLVSNPTTASLDWDHPEWVRDNIDETIYVWDPSANGGAGEYLVWNGVAGNLQDGLVETESGLDADDHEVETVRQAALNFMLPLARPTTSTVAIFLFMWIWNDFLYPLVYMQSQERYTVPLGVMFLGGQFQPEWGLQMAGLTVATAVPLLAYYFFQKQFIRGVLAGAVKG
jgi:hypothetical protein